MNNVDKCISMACPECKAKITDMASKLTKWDMIRPKRLASKFLNALCKDCKKNMVAEVRGK